jgi:hypothetical protein
VGFYWVFKEGDIVEDGNWQTWVALAIVALAVTLLVRSIVRKRGSSCGSDCGCSGKELKADIDRSQKASEKEPQ